MEKVKFFLQDSLNSESVKSLNKFGLATFLSCLASAACGYFEYSITEPCSVVKRPRSRPIFLKLTGCSTLLGFFFLPKVFPKFYPAVEMSALNQAMKIHSGDIFLGFLQPLFPSWVTHPEQKNAFEQTDISLITREPTGCKQMAGRESDLLCKVHLGRLWAFYGETTSDTYLFICSVTIRECLQLYGMHYISLMVR